MKRFLVVWLMGMSLLWSAPSSGSEAVKLANEIRRCSAPALLETTKMSEPGPAGFGTEIDGEPYYFMIEERIKLSFHDRANRAHVVEALVDRPGAGRFDEQKSKRTRFMEETADRAGVGPERRDLGSGLTVISVSRSQLKKGSTVGLSLMIDPLHEATVQWNWLGSDSYTTIEEAKALQETIWKAVGPCLAKRQRPNGS